MPKLPPDVGTGQMTDGAAWGHDVVRLASAETGRAYQIWVETPGRYPGSDARYPVVLCLDGPWTYGVVRDAFRILPLSGELPEAIVVGVAHDEPDLRTVLQQRAMDFTPTAAAAPAATGVRVPAEQLGQASAFRAFLTDSVLPIVGERYRCQDGATLVGHSFSGLFGLHWLLQEPSAFSRWVLTSPSVWWDDRFIFRQEAEQAATGRDLATRLFLSMSEGDESVGGGGFGGHDEFHAQLTSRGRPGLDCGWARFPGETHTSVVAASVVRGLRHVFRS